MSFKFNLFPTQPQKSYYPKGQRDSTSNSLYNKEVSNRSVVNQTIDNSKQNSSPNLLKKQGSSNTYNDGTGDRLLKLKANAIAGSNK